MVAEVSGAVILLMMLAIALGATTIFTVRKRRAISRKRQEEIKNRPAPVLSAKEKFILTGDEQYLEQALQEVEG